jgi:hypothetical protein
MIYRISLLNTLPSVAKCHTQQQQSDLKSCQPKESDW